MTEKFITREAAIEAEMNPATNPLIPGGKAADDAAVETLYSDTSVDGVRRREMDVFSNPLIIGSPLDKDAAVANMCADTKLSAMSPEQMKACVNQQKP